MKKKGNKNMPTPRQKVIHNPIPTSLFLSRSLPEGIWIWIEALGSCMHACKCTRGEFALSGYIAKGHIQRKMGSNIKIGAVFSEPD